MDKVVVCISDIHGCIDEFKEILNKIQYKPSQMRVVLLGDLVDRGPDAKAVIAKARELKLESVKGNHEDRVVRFLKHEEKKRLFGTKNPMKVTSSHDSKEALRLDPEDVEYIDNLPYKINLGNNSYAIHAGIEPGKPFDQQVPAQLMRVRYVNSKGFGVPLNPDKSIPKNTVLWEEKHEGEQNIIYGHFVHSLEAPRVYENKKGALCIGTDTGCVFGGNLTAIFLHFYDNKLKPEFVQVKANKIYATF